jgi:hypothetical protein
MATNNHRFIEGNVPNSITSNDNTVLALDSNHPFSFVRWVEYNKILYSNIADLLNKYQKYVNNWYEVKNKVPVNESTSVKDLYTNLINEIILSYTSTDERRFLKNLDTNNPRDLAIAVPFFAERVKDICLYYASLRDRLPYTAVEYNLKGSIFGLENLIYSEVSKALEAREISETIKSLNLSVSSIRNNLQIEIEEIYDQYKNYLDLGTLPASAYNAFSGQRAEYFDFNTCTIKPNLYIDFNQEIIDTIKAYPFFLIELGTNNFTISYNVKETDYNYLKDRNFINLINDATEDNLSLNTEYSLNKKYMGTDYYYVSTGSTATDYVSGRLFEANSPFANVLNVNTPTVAAVPSNDFLFTSKQLGLFFKSDKIGLLTFAGVNFAHVLSAATLSANNLYIFPNPSLYGKVVGGTKQDQKSPLVFSSDDNVLKYNYVNSYGAGEAISDPLLPTYKGYQSREQSIKYTDQGVARYVDPQDFFTGLKKNTWANPDLYPVDQVIGFPLESRQQALLALNNKTLVQYKSDVFGNDYGMYKTIEPQKNLQASIAALNRFNGAKLCTVIDGYVFYDINNGPLFNYATDIPEEGYIFTGVEFKTVDTYNASYPLFALSSIPTNIESYNLQPETFCSAYVETVFNCNIREAFTFIAPNSGLLTDYPSDNSNFNPATTPVYYNILADAGVNALSPDHRATFAFEGTFLYTAPDTVEYNGSYFVVSAFSDVLAPCDSLDIIDNNLFLKNYFYDVGSPGSITTIDETVYPDATRKTIYETKFETYGDFYFRSNNSSIIAPVSSALSGLFIKYSSYIFEEISQKLINFDVYYDLLQLETENYLIFDRIEYDTANDIIKSSSTGETYIKRGDNKRYEKISTVWFKEKENELVFAATTLHPTFSATNFKVIYPKIYSFNLAKNTLTQMYPIQTTTFNELDAFSLSGTNFDVDIAAIDKPIMSYNNETGEYSLTYLARDTSELFYMFTYVFKYINGVLSNIRNTMHKPDIEISHNNFSNPSDTFEFYTYNIAGPQGGYIQNGVFNFWDFGGGFGA